MQLRCHKIIIHGARKGVVNAAFQTANLALLPLAFNILSWPKFYVFHRSTMLSRERVEVWSVSLRSSGRRRSPGRRSGRRRRRGRRATTEKSQVGGIERRPIMAPIRVLETLKWHDHDHDMGAKIGMLFPNIHYQHLHHNHDFDYDFLRTWPGQEQTLTITISMTMAMKEQGRLWFGDGQWS